MRKKYYLFFILLLAFASCQNKKESNQESKIYSIADYPKSNNNQAFIGTYIGVLPCGDCEGMETKITINENNTYTKSVHYLGKGDKIFEQKGGFSWNTLGNVIQMTDIENAPNQYLVTEGKLIQLDLEGSIIEGALAKEYVLIKQPETLTNLESVHPNTDKINLNNKLESTASIEQVNPAEGKYTLAETKWKLLTVNGKIAKQEGNKPNFIKMNSSDGKFSAYAGCNTMFGSYAMPSVNKIYFSEIGATRMACPNMTTENNFMSMLDMTTKYKLDKETLTFYGSGKTPIATFVAQK